MLAQGGQIAQLLAALAQLQADNEGLRLRLDKNKKPVTDSSNSSQPPTRDQKGSLPSEPKKGKHGLPKGHRKHERGYVADPDHVVNVKTDSCAACQANLEGEEAELLAVNQITKLPAASAEVIEVRQFGPVCPGGGNYHLPQPPAGLEMGRTFGARLEAEVVYYRVEEHMSYQGTQMVLWDLHGVKISQGSIDRSHAA